MAKTKAQALAHRAVRSALESGRMTRPDRCSQCGAKNSPYADGRSSIQAHHHKGYDHPLDVEWLCARCHSATDEKKHGEGHPFAVLTEAEVRQIVSLKESGLSRWRIAAKMELSPHTVRSVLYGGNWEWLTHLKKTRSQINTPKL